MIQDLNDQFTNEISTKQDKLDQIQAQVIETTRELASLRRQLAAENAKSAQLDSIGYKRQNLERALKLQEAEEWSEVDDTDIGDISETNPPDDLNLLTEEISSLSDDQRILHLRRIRSWQSHMEEKLQSKVTGAQNLDAEKLEQYKKAMASRLKVPVEAIDEVSMRSVGLCGARLIPRCCTGHARSTVESCKCFQSKSRASAKLIENIQVENDGLKLDLPQMNLATASS